MRSEHDLYTGEKNCQDGLLPTWPFELITVRPFRGIC